MPVRDILGMIFQMDNNCLSELLADADDNLRKRVVRNMLVKMLLKLVPLRDAGQADLVFMTIEDLNEVKSHNYTLYI